MLDLIYTFLFYPLIKWTLILIAISYAIYRYYSSKCIHWEQQGVPTASVSLLTRFFKPWHIWEQDLYIKYGKLFGVYELTRPVLYLSDPDLIRDVLVKDFHSFTNRRRFTTGSDPIMDNMVSVLRDDTWKRVRTVMSPTFTTGKLKRMLPLINECLQTMGQNLDTVSQSQSAVGDMKRLFGAYTMEAVIQVAFGTRVDALYDEDNPIIANARRLLSRDISPKFFVLILAPKLAEFMRLTVFDKSVTDFFSDFTLKIIADRKRQLKNSSTGSQKRVDFLQLMLDSMANSGSSSSSSDVGAGNVVEDMVNNNNSNNNNSKEKYQELSTNSTETIEKYLTNDEFIAQCVLFFIAGYETTANTLSLTIYLLAKHTKVQDRLRAEVDQYFQQHYKQNTDGVVDYDVLHSLKYLDAVIQETLRLYPAALFLEREANSDYQLGGKQGGGGGAVTIKKGHLLHIPLYAIHRDPANFADPLEYRPERFLPDNIAHHPYAYAPFGAGPRNCIGMRLAQMEAKLALVNAIHGYRFHDTGKPLEFFNSAGIMSPKTVTIRVEKLM